MSIFDRDNQDIFSFEIDESVNNTFHEMTRWTKFLAILGFVFLGLMVVGGLAVAVYLSNMNLGRQFDNMGGSIGIALLYILISLVYFYPTYALLKYSTSMKQALAMRDKTKFSAAITYLKNMFKYIGITMILFLALYGVIIIISIARVAG
jgi:hypothetical protein